MKRRVERVLAVLLCVFCAAAPAWAEKADRSRPVQVEADSVHMDDARKTAVYEGHVILTQGTMTMLADRIDVNQDAQGMTSGVATGKPVHFKQKMEGRDEYMEADANRIEYDARTQVVRLIGAAHLKQGEDELRGGTITYDMRTERYKAEGATDGGGGRVHAVIRPRNQGAPAKP
jgi:lipopolysaccharide export system protein LptA